MDPPPPPPVHELENALIRLITSLLGVKPLEPNTEKEEGRIFWSSVGDVIEAMPFLPVTFNVPDILAGMSSAFSNAISYMFGGLFGGGGTEAQTEMESVASETTRIVEEFFRDVGDALDL